MERPGRSRIMRATSSFECSVEMVSGVDALGES